MKLIILLSVVAWSSCAKLDRTYLPPSHAQSSGGSNFLQAPDSSLARGNGFGPTNDFSLSGAGRNSNGFNRNRNGVNQNGNGFNQNRNGFNKNRNGFNQNRNGFNQNGNGFNQNGNGFNTFNGGFNGNGVAAERPQASFERNAAILRQDSQNDGETYSYAYETENGIYAEESGVATNGVEAQGSYSYTGDDGQVYTVRYTADQNGFVPNGDHLPTAPPVPEDILKALEQNARDEAAGIYDDGSYSEDKYGNDNNQYNGNNYNNRNNFNNGNNYNNVNTNRDFDGNDEDSVVTNSAVFRSSNPGSNGSRRFNGATEAYLPPVQTQRSQGPRAQGKGIGTRKSRPSFNTRDGYNY